MVNSLITNVMPTTYVTTNSAVSRSKPTFLINRSRSSSLTLSQPLNSTGRLPLISLLSRRRSTLLPARSLLNGVPTLDLKPNQGLGDYIELELQVRDYEVDHYGVVNNAVYSSYCQHAHHEFLINKLGVEYGEGYDGRANPLAVSNLSFKFIAPLKNREKFIFKVKVSHASVARIFFEHFIYKLPNYEPILEAKSTLVWLDENHRPVRMPLELKYKFMQLGLYR